MARWALRSSTGEAKRGWVNGRRGQQQLQCCGLLLSSSAGEEEDAVAMIVRAPEPGSRSMPIEVDSGEEEETVVQEKTKTKATRRSNRLQGARG